MGSTTGWASGAFDNVNPNTARLSNPWSVLFLIIGSDVSLYLGETGNHRIRRMNLVSPAVTTWSGAWLSPAADTAAGGSSGTTTNVLKAQGKFSSPRGITYTNNVMYISDTGNNRMVRISFISGYHTVALASQSGISDVAAYRGRVYYALSGLNRLYVANVYSGLRPVFLGSATASDSIAVGNVLFSDIRGLSVDCSRKSIFVP